MLFITFQQPKLLRYLIYDYIKGKFCTSYQKSLPLLYKTIIILTINTYFKKYIMQVSIPNITRVYFKINIILIIIIHCTRQGIWSYYNIFTNVKNSTFTKMFSLFYRVFLRVRIYLCCLFFIQLKLCTPSRLKNHQNW